MRLQMILCRARHTVYAKLFIFHNAFFNENLLLLLGGAV